MLTTYSNALVVLDFDLQRLQIRSEEHSVEVTGKKKSKIKGFEHRGAALHKWYFYQTCSHVQGSDESAQHSGRAQRSYKVRLNQHAISFTYLRSKPTCFQCQKMSELILLAQNHNLVSRSVRQVYHEKTEQSLQDPASSF